MSYAILRIKKISSIGNVASLEAHLERSRNTPNANPKLTLKNESFIDGSLLENLKNQLPEKVRKNGVIAVEHLMTASPDFFENKNSDEIKQWTLQSIDWAKKEYGEEKILSAHLHLDEKSPHLHLVTIPLVDGKLNARKLYNGRSKLVQMQDSYAKHISQTFPLQRGETGSKAHHTTIKEFYNTIQKPIEKPQKNHFADITYTKRLEEFIEEKTPLMVENRIAFGKKYVIDEEVEKQFALRINAEITKAKEEMRISFDKELEELKLKHFYEKRSLNFFKNSAESQVADLTQEIETITQNATKELTKKIETLQKQFDNDLLKAQKELKNTQTSANRTIEEYKKQNELALNKQKEAENTIRTLEKENGQIKKDNNFFKEYYEAFNDITEYLYQMNKDWQKKGYTKENLISFYLQSYDEMVAEQEKSKNQDQGISR